MPHAPARVGRVHAANHRDLFHDRQDFKLADFHRHGVGVAVRHQAAGGAMAGHAEAAGVVNDDEVRPAAFDEFCADAGACARGDDRLAFFERGAEALDDLLARVGISFSSPGIWHGQESRFRF